MKFSIAHVRDVIGFRITVLLQAEAAESISEVSTELDSFSLGRDTLNPAETQYTRAISQAGGFTTGAEHIVKVTATIAGGVEKTASDRWND